ncbi:MAG: hypothetical protein ACREBW_03220, partial [Candidatus Micrarchaeaceae archaeon]
AIIETTSNDLVVYPDGPDSKPSVELRPKGGITYNRRTQSFVDANGNPFGTLEKTVGDVSGRQPYGLFLEKGWDFIRLKP